jgi:hypothetical protein
MAYGRPSSQIDDIWGRCYLRPIVIVTVFKRLARREAIFRVGDEGGSMCQHPSQ